MDRYDIEIEHVAFEIHPETPQEGVNLYERIPGAKQGLAQLRERGKPLGLTFGDIEIMSNTKKALLVGEYAKEKGVSGAYSKAMFQAYFADARDIGNEDIILDIAKSVGLDQEGATAAFTSAAYEAILEENLRLGHELNIRSVPTFIVNDEVMVVGSQPEAAFVQVFDQLAGKGQDKKFVL